jgi:hypothetical protein
MTKAQALSIIGSVLSSLFGKSLEHIGEYVNDKFIEIHTVSSLSYFVIALMLAIVEFGYANQSSMRKKLQIVGIVLNFLGTEALTSILLISSH